MFKLNIECTKDINELHITFADGTSVVTSNSSSAVVSAPRVPREPKPQQEKVKPERTERADRQEKFLDTDADFGSVSQEVVQLPEINRTDRPVKVASELQNLDI
jgi:hypothetical protein